MTNKCYACNARDSNYILDKQFFADALQTLREAFPTATWVWDWSIMAPEDSSGITTVDEQGRWRLLTMQTAPMSPEQDGWTPAGAKEALSYLLNNLIASIQARLRTVRKKTGSDYRVILGDFEIVCRIQALPVFLAPEPRGHMRMSLQLRCGFDPIP